MKRSRLLYQGGLIVSVFVLSFVLFGVGVKTVLAATTYYVCNNATTCNANSSGWVTGSDNNSCTSKNSACLTFQGGNGKMVGGDTLVFGDGTYTGTNNSVDKNSHPPFGNSSAWTIIKAEHDGGVIFNNASFAFADSGGNYAFYWQVEGLIWANGYFYIDHGHHVKVLRCGGYNAGSGNNVNFSAGRGSSDILFEDSYAWGEGRYKFMGYQSSNIIIRRCVGRLDKEDAGGEPIGIFALYSVANGKIQNSIGIDSDVPNYWTNVYNRIGCFGVPVTQMNASNITVENSICLNSDLGGVYYEGGGYTSSDMMTRNNVIWDVDTASSFPNNFSRSIRPTWINNTFGVSTTSEEYLSGYGSSNMQITNNLFYSISNTLASNWGAHDYNAYWQASTGRPALSSHETASINPIWNASTNPTGALKYITRIESGSNLTGIGSGGSNIGATVMKMVGVSGTLYGDPGYDTEQSTSMWPFPNENLIKSKMAAYTYPGINGARGFAAPGNGLYGGPITLTSYIWEYLGNPCPAGICVSTPDTTSPTWPSGTTFSASATSSSSITVTWSSATDNVGVTSYTVQRCTGLPAACPDASFATVGTPAASPFVNNTGLSPNTDYSYRVRASDAAGNISGWTNTVSAKTQPLDTTPPTITLTAPASTLPSGTTSTILSVTTDKNATCRYATTAGVTYASMTNTFTTTGATTHSTTISGLTTGTTHRYVRCINGNTGGQPTTTDLDVSITVSAPAAPVITSATTAGGTTGTAFSYQITATNNPTSFSATNLPSWALINTTSGIISGTPTSAGTATVTIGATNATGTGTTTLVVTVAVAPPISQNLLLGLNFNEGTGTTAQDVSGHNHTGTLSNATWTTGKNGGGISFSGNANSYIDIPNESDFDLTTNFTVSLWMKTSTFGSAWAALVSKGDSSWSLTRYNTANTLDFNTFSPSANDLQGTVNVASNTWHHVAIVYDGATKKLYVDGAVDAQASFTQTLSTNNFPVRIGGNAEYTTGTFNGSVDDVRIYNKALTQAEITTDMNTPLTQPASAASCNTVTTSNFSQSAYNSYGAPFDAFQTSTNLLDAKCTSADTHTINLTTGVTGDTTRIVYTKGYYYDPVTAGWTQYSGTCNGALNGEWCQGSVSATITNPNISTASASNPTYLVGMTCSVQGGGWKCGCRDTTCSNFYWQVQGAGQ